MVALTKDRKTSKRSGSTFNDPVAAATKIYAGSITVLDAAGNAVPGTVAAGLIARGVAQELVDNGAGIAGDKRINTEPGIYKFANAGDITRAHIGDNAYIDDDQTVIADGTGRSVAGEITDVDSDGIWVQIG